MQMQVKRISKSMAILFQVCTVICALGFAFAVVALIIAIRDPSWNFDTVVGTSGLDATSVCIMMMVNCAFLVAICAIARSLFSSVKRSGNPFSAHTILHARIIAVLVVVMSIVCPIVQASLRAHAELDAAYGVDAQGIIVGIVLWCVSVYLRFGNTRGPVQSSGDSGTR